jgi:hypothetical protein
VLTSFGLFAGFIVLVSERRSPRQQGPRHPRLCHRSSTSIAVYAAAPTVQGFLTGLMLWLAGTAPVVEGDEDGATLAMVE